MPITTSLIIATRESRLALWQAEHVKTLIEQTLGLRVELLGITTSGDQIVDRSLSKAGGKGLFVKELETALAEGRAQLAVHSLKDVPMDLPDGFELAAVLQRADARDAFVSARYASLDELPRGARVGTSSLRRIVQLHALRSDLHIEPLRGNLDTRLRKLDDGGFDAIVLAAAGLERLGLAARIRSTFTLAQMLPCAGQGALAIEVRSQASALMHALAGLNDRASWLATAAERAVSRALGGSCTMPLAAHAVWRSEAMLDIETVLGHAQTTAQPLLRARASAAVQSDADACALGAQAAAMLREGGAAEYLQAST